MRAIKNAIFIEFEPLCQKLWAFMSNFVIFYNARSPNMAMSRDPRSKFPKKKLFFPNCAFNIRKSYKMPGRKVLYFKSYQPKSSRGGGGVENTLPPVLLGLTLPDLIRKGEGGRSSQSLKGFPRLLNRDKILKQNFG